MAQDGSRQEVDTRNGIIKIGGRVKVGPTGAPAGAIGTVRHIYGPPHPRMGLVEVHLDDTPDNQFILESGVRLFPLK